MIPSAGRERAVQILAIEAEDQGSSLAEQAYALLEEKLVTLQLQPGAMVSEGDLIELTGFGRTPVREAIQRLAQQELFQVRPRRGLVVAPVSSSGMQQVLEARKPLERLVAQRAALNARDHQRSELSALAREMSFAHERFDELLRLGRTFEQLLDDCAGNGYAARALAPLRSHSRRFWYFHRQQVKLADVAISLAQLARLVARRDANGAQKASDANIASLEKLVIGVERPA